MIAASFITMSDSASAMAANFWRAWWAWLICFALTIIISLFTKKRDESELVGLVKGLTEEKADDHIPTWKKPSFWAIISLVALVVLNIYFW
jgi:SSS family solute:Na+ symporter